MTRHIQFLVALVAVASLIVSPAQAGDGEIVDGKLNISVMFTYLDSDPDAWRPLFEEGSRLLYNSTNGQLQFGQVRVLNCAFDKDAADVWILDGNSGAFANPLGLGGFGHIFLSQTHKSTILPALGQFGLVHEMGHYGFGLYDEYKGEEVQTLLAGGEQTDKFLEPHQFCVTDLDPIACLMDGGTTVAPNNGRTEFCTHAHEGLSTQHNEGIEIDGTIYVNAQQVYNGESCWETIERILGLVSPTEVDTEDPPGLDPIEWSIAPGFNRVVILVDRSYSMVARPEKITLAKEAGNLLVALLHEEKTVEIDGADVQLPGENLGIISFANNTTLEFEMQEIMDESTKDLAQTIIDEISSPATQPLSTDMGAGLQASLDEIEAHGEISACSEAIVLLSDGGHNGETDPLGLLPDLMDRGVRVYTIGLGTDPNAELMEEIADSTGGGFFQAAEAEDLPDIMTLIASEVRAAGMIAAYQDSIFGLDESVQTFIDALAEEVTAILEWDQGILDMVLTSPTGDVITLESALEREDVEAGMEGNLLFIRVVNPETGLWEARISAIEQDGMTYFDLTILDENRNILVRATTDKEVYTFPDPVRLRVDVIADVPVAGADVQATVERPGADPVTIPVFDDGNPAHNDQWANDGVYNTIFGNFSQDGVYTFHVLVVNENGTGPDPDLPFVEDGADPPVTIPPFVRETEVSVLVEGVTGLIAVDLDFNPPTLNVKNTNGRVTCYLEMPEPILPEDIDTETLRLNDVVEPDDWPITIGDHDGDGVPDLMVKFDRGEVIEVLPDGMEVEVRITGNLLDGRMFEGRAMITLINSEPVPLVNIFPELVVVGEEIVISWDPVEAVPVTYSGFLSRDGGWTWQHIFNATDGTTSHVWEVTEPTTTEALIVVQVDSPEGVADQLLSPPFEIQDASGLEDIPTHVTGIRVMPNPVQGTAVLQYSLATAANVRLEIYDVSGRLIRRVAAGQKSAGSHVATWDGTDTQGRRVSSGVYLYVFEAGSYKKTGRMMMVR
jgi:hypothetical protein